MEKQKTKNNTQEVSAIAPKLMARTPDNKVKPAAAALPKIKVEKIEAVAPKTQILRAPLKADIKIASPKKEVVLFQLWQFCGFCVIREIPAY